MTWTEILYPALGAVALYLYQKYVQKKPATPAPDGSPSSAIPAIPVGPNGLPVLTPTQLVQLLVSEFMKVVNERLGGSFKAAVAQALEEKLAPPGPGNAPPL